MAEQVTERQKTGLVLAGGGIPMGIWKPAPWLPLMTFLKTAFV